MNYFKLDSAETIVVSGSFEYKGKIEDSVSPVERTARKAFNKDCIKKVLIAIAATLIALGIIGAMGTGVLGVLALLGKKIFLLKTLEIIFTTYGQWQPFAMLGSGAGGIISLMLGLAYTYRNSFNREIDYNGTEESKV